MSFFESLMSEVTEPAPRQPAPAPVKKQSRAQHTTSSAAKSKEPTAFKSFETGIAGYRQAAPVEKKQKPTKKPADDVPAHEIEGRERKRPGQGKRQAALALRNVGNQHSKRSRDDDGDAKGTRTPSPRNVKTEHKPTKAPNERTFTRLFGKDLDDDKNDQDVAQHGSMSVRLSPEQLKLSEEEARMMSARVAARKDLTAEEKEDFRKLYLPESEPEPESDQEDGLWENDEGPELGQVTNSDDENSVVNWDEEPVDANTEWKALIAEEFGIDLDLELDEGPDPGADTETRKASTHTDGKSVDEDEGAFSELDVSSTDSITNNTHTEKYLSHLNREIESNGDDDDDGDTLGEANAAGTECAPDNTQIYTLPSANLSFARSDYDGDVDTTISTGNPFLQRKAQAVPSKGKLKRSHPNDDNDDGYSRSDSKKRRATSVPQSPPKSQSTGRNASPRTCRGKRDVSAAPSSTE